MRDLFFRCERCGDILRPYKTDSGEEIGLRRHCAISKGKYKAVLCLACIEQKNKEKGAGINAK